MADFFGRILDNPIRVAAVGDDRFGRFLTPVGSAGGDATPPTIDNFDPNPGVEISQGRAISFDVKDNLSAFSAIMVLVEYPTGAYEVAWGPDATGGESFAAAYAIDSSRVPITGGFRYTVKRQGLWPATPTFRAVAIDGSGNQAT